jgi:hypothetical protein
MAFLEKKLLSKKDLFILFGRAAGTRLYNLIYKCCGLDNFTSYTVSLKQFGVGADPTVEVLFSNGLQVTATYSYVNPGEYLVTFDKSIFNSPSDYATILGGTFTNGANTFLVQVVPIFFNVISITSFKNGVPSDDVLGSSIPTILDIRKYN